MNLTRHLRTVQANLDQLAAEHRDVEQASTGHFLTPTRRSR